MGLSLCPRMQGFTRGRKLDKIGRKGQDTAELFFDGPSPLSGFMLPEAPMEVPLPGLSEWP
jgi:alkylation response protein AidB-like acyl-CoA dehydrogenase